MFGQNALWVELNTKNRARCVPDRHDFTVFGKRICDQGFRELVRLDRQGVIAHHIVCRWQPLEERPPFVANFIDLSVPNFLSGDDFTALCGTDALMPETNAENG